MGLSGYVEPPPAATNLSLPVCHGSGIDSSTPLRLWLDATPSCDHHIKGFEYLPGIGHDDGSRHPGRFQQIKRRHYVISPQSLIPKTQVANKNRRLLKI